MSGSDTEVQSTTADRDALRWRADHRSVRDVSLPQALTRPGETVIAPVDDAPPMHQPPPFFAPQPQPAGSGVVPPVRPPTAVGGPNGDTGDDSGVTGGRVSAGSGVLVAPAQDDRPRRRVAILGYTTSLGEAPFGDPDWELWGMNNLHTKMPPEQVNQCSRWYQIHSEKDIAGNPEHVAWLKESHPFPIYMADPLEGLDAAPDGTPIPSLAERTGRPNAVVFPRAQILMHFMRYFTNTVSWQVAHALFEALYDESYVLSDIGLFGIDLAVGTEYASQRPSAEFFLGICVGLGVQLTIPASSDLLKAAELYGGEDEHSGFRAKCETRLKELHEQKAHIETQVAQAQQMHASICGAIDSFAYVQGVWLPPKSAGNARDAVMVPAGSLSPVAQLIADGEARERHGEGNKET